MEKRTKPKILPPTLRVRRRYIKFKILSDDSIAYSDLEHAIWDAMFDFFGEDGVAKMDMWLIKNLYDEGQQTGVIRCNNKSVQDVIAGLGLLTRLGDVRIVVKILRISGTIKGLKRK